MDRLDQLFQQFLRERTYITNVTSDTRDWYGPRGRRSSGHGLQHLLGPSSAPLISRTDLQSFVVHLRERGVKPCPATRGCER